MIIFHYLQALVNFLHFSYPKFKHAAPVIFFVLVFLPFFSGSFVYGQKVFGTVKTPVTITVDGNSKKLVSTQNTVSGALTQGGIFLNKNDVTEPSLETELTGVVKEIKVVRALPVLISDNNQEMMTTSAYSDSIDILNQLQIPIYPEDTVSINLILDPADEQTIGQKVVIERAPVYTIHVDGQDLIVRSWESTVNTVIKDKVTLGLRDIVEPGLQTRITGGEITVTRINVVDFEEVVPIEYSISYRDDYYVAQGVEKTVTAGANGSKKDLVRIRYKNGLVESRMIIDSTVLTNPVIRVVSRGLMPLSHPDFDSSYWSMMVLAGQKYGISPLSLFKVAACESHVNPFSAGNYYGMYQYNLGFWSQASADAGFAGASWKDARAQIFSTAKYASSNGWGRWGCRP